jgi:two-component system chemotaxis sensor kinase CheA
MTTLLERFIPEAREHLQNAAAGLLKLECDPSDQGLVNEVFRAVHTLKGGSGLFDLPSLTRLVHAGEDLLGAVRSNRLPLDSAMVDALLDALDLVSAWVDELERRGQLPADAEGISLELSRRLRTPLPESTRVAAKGTESAIAGELVPDWLADLAEPDRLAAFAETIAGGPPLLAITYGPDEGCFYRGEDPFNLFSQLPGLKALQVSQREQPAPLAEVDPFRCTLAFQALVAQSRPDVAHLFRYVSEQVTIAAVPVEALVVPAGNPSSDPVDANFVEDARQRLARRDLAGLRRAAAAVLGVTDRQLRVASTLRWLDAVLAAPLPNLAWARALVDAVAMGRTVPLGPAAADAKAVSPPPVADASRDKPMAARILAEQMRIVAMPGDAETLRRRTAAVEATVGNLLASLGTSLRGDELAAAAAAAAAGTPGPLAKLLCVLAQRLETAASPSSAGAAVEAEHPETHQLARVLKVDPAKVDALMALIAELVVSKNSLPFLARRAEDIYGSREMSREIKDQYAVIDRLAQEMQRAIMDVRLLPVSEVFERFPRLVRDLARKLDKRIELKIIGENTAADKTIIESLADPLLHLVRNAIDHGVETPEQRGEAGKPETATIQLRAFQEGGQVIIEVSDDGKGIDPAVIRAKAIEKALISEANADTLSDQDAVNLIFLPGFSTATEVSDVSGRGVGMDVVRTTIEKINGQVSISSRKSEGTLVRLALPLSMAITRVMTVEVGSGLYGVPMDGVVETVRVPRERIRKIKQSETFALRDAIVPLVRMHTLLGIERSTDEVENEAVLVARVGSAIVGFVVDRFREGIDAILKPLAGVLAGMRGYSGSTLLGDGRVLLVLNLKELL